MTAINLALTEIILARTIAILAPTIIIFAATAIIFNLTAIFLGQMAIILALTTIIFAATAIIFALMVIVLSPMAIIALRQSINILINRQRRVLVNDKFPQNWTKKFGHKKLRQKYLGLKIVTTTNFWHKILDNEIVSQKVNANLDTNI